MDSKKIIKISAILVVIAGVTFGAIKLVKYLRTRSGDPQKNNRRIVVKRLNIF